MSYGKTEWTAKHINFQAFVYDIDKALCVLLVFQWAALQGPAGRE